MSKEKEKNVQETSKATVKEVAEKLRAVAREELVALTEETEAGFHLCLVNGQKFHITVAEA